MPNKDVISQTQTFGVEYNYILYIGQVIFCLLTPTFLGAA